MSARVAMKESRPDIIVDFVFEGGLFFISLRNIGSQPALKVKTHFEPGFCGMGGSLDMATLPLFQSVEFFAPNKEIRTLLDTSSAYFGRGEPTSITVRVVYGDREGVTYEGEMYHDLKIYQSIQYMRK